MSSVFNLPAKAVFSTLMKGENEKKKGKRADLGARWTAEERKEINDLAAEKGIKPTQVIRMAVRSYLNQHAQNKN